jgi:hypothetical protein
VSAVDSVGVLIFFAIVGAFICARTRSAAGAVVFSLVAIVLFIATPVGAGLPQAVGEFLTAVNRAASPALTDPPDGDEPAHQSGKGEPAEHSGAVG